MVKGIWVSPNIFTQKMGSIGGHHLQLHLITENSHGVTLSYVIRKDTPRPYDRDNMDVHIIHQESLVGNMFIRESRKVIDILKELTLGTYAKTCIKVLKFVRKATQELQAYYDGTSEVARRKFFSGANLKKNFYKNGTNFTFEKYVTKLKGIFNVLEKYGVTLYEDQMVENIIYQIMSPITELKTEVNICRLSHSYTFVNDYTYLYTVVTRLNPSTNPSSGCFRKRGIYATGRGDRGSERGGNFNGQGRDRGCGGRGGRGKG